MGVFEKAFQERHPSPESVTLTPHEAFAAMMIGAFNADGRAAQEEAVRVNEIFSSTKLFRPVAGQVRAVVERVSELFRAYGADVVLALAADALPVELRAPAFAVAVDLVLADGEATTEERKYIDGLQALLKISDEDALKIVEVLILKNSA